MILHPQELTHRLCTNWLHKRAQNRPSSHSLEPAHIEQNVPLTHNMLHVVGCHLSKHLSSLMPTVLNLVPTVFFTCNYNSIPVPEVEAEQVGLKMASLYN
jgi:hypothetical protein